MPTGEEKIRILPERDEEEGEKGPHYQSINDEKVTFKTEEKTGDKSLLGIFLCILSGFFLIGGNTLTKLASVQSKSISSWQLLLLRSVVFLVLILPLIIWKKIGIFGPNDRALRLKLALQAVLANLLIFCYYEGMIRLPLGDYQAIIFSSPVFTMILSVFLIKDRFGLYRVVLAIILTIGIIVICRPSSLFPRDSLRQASRNSSKMLYVDVETLDVDAEVLDKNPTDVVGIVFALAGAILSAWITILARQLNTVNFCVQLIWGSVGGVIISIVALLSNNSLQGLESMSGWPRLVWFLSVGQSFLGLAGTVAILVALKWITPTKNKVLRSFQVVGSYIIQVELFGTRAHCTDYAGAGLIVLAVLGIAVEDVVVGRLRKKLPYI